jgi:hypothetical protein
VWCSNIVIALQVEPEKITECSNRQMRFLLCESCFWCATCLDPDVVVSKCPVCEESRVESLPISYDETCKFDYDSRRGITLEFFTTDRRDEQT